MTKQQINEFTLRTTQANHSGLVVVLFEIIDVYIRDALEAYNEADTDEFVRCIEKAKKAHNELMSAMNPSDANGYQVLILLRYMYKVLATAAVTRKPDELDRVCGMLGKLKDIFTELNSRDNETAVMKNTHQVYAGLTYGKRSLNESYGTADYSNRGFMA